MDGYEYLLLKIENNDVITKYNLQGKETKEGYVYIEVQKRICGLPKTGIISQELLEEILGRHGYKQNEYTPGVSTNLIQPGGQQLQSKIHQRRRYSAVMTMCPGYAQIWHTLARHF